MRNGGVRLQIYTTNHLKIQILLKREKFNLEINILWLGRLGLKMSDILRCSEKWKPVKSTPIRPKIWWKATGGYLPKGGMLNDSSSFQVSFVYLWCWIFLAFCLLKIFRKQQNTKNRRWSNRHEKWGFLRNDFTFSLKYGRTDW